MNDSDKVAYLANVLMVAFADNTLSPRESAALEEIRKSVDAKKSHLATAQKNVESGGYTMSRAGSFADQVRNLEDILFVALSDSELDPKESQLVSDYCQLIGVYQDQLDKIIADSSRRCDSSSHSILCPSCSSPAAAQARFCPGCGKALTASEGDSVQVGFDISQTGYAIEFAESSAGGFSTALQIARDTGRMQTVTRNKKTWHMTTFDARDFASMVPLAAALSGMRNRRVVLDGQELPWDQVFGFTWCAAQRAGAYRPLEYCFGKDENRFNPWGCKQARLDWSEWAPWLSYGHWKKSGILGRNYVFVFDKQRISHEVAAALFRVRFCPHLRSQLAEAVIRHLPDEVEVTEKGDWKFNQVFEEVPGAIKVVERSGSGDFSYTNEYYSDGVRPRGLGALAAIMKRAFADCGIADVSANSLLGK
jgi:hypothetical protein